MPFGPFTLYTTLGAGVWTAILAATGFWLGRTAGDITYLELVRRGKAFIDGNMGWVALAAAIVVALHFAASRLVMRSRGPRA